MTSPTLYLLDELRHTRRLLADAIENELDLATIAGLELAIDSALEQLFEGGEVGAPVRSFSRTPLRPSIMLIGLLEVPWPATAIPFERVRSGVRLGEAGVRCTRPDAFALLEFRSPTGLEGSEWLAWHGDGRSPWMTWNPYADDGRAGYIPMGWSPQPWAPPDTAARMADEPIEIRFDPTRVIAPGYAVSARAMLALENAARDEEPDARELASPPEPAP